MKISFFSKEHLPPDELLDDVSTLFRNNIPSFDDKHSVENEEQIAERSSPEQYKNVLNEVCLIVMKNARDKVAGILEWELPSLPENNLAVLRWVVVAESERGQGFATVLHQLFEASVAKIVRVSRFPVSQVLSVHSSNPARSMYQKWGYAEVAYPDDPDNGRFVLMKKNVCP